MTTRFNKLLSTQSFRTWWLMGLALLVMAGGLSGCATPSTLNSQVSSFGTWPEARKPGKFAFERLPSQQSQPGLQDKLEAAALPALQAAGFEPVTDAKQADALVQVGAQIRTESRRSYRDPFWGPWGPGFGGWWGGRGGFGISMSMSSEPSYVQTQVDVLIRDRQTNQVLYETHANMERMGSADEGLYPYLFQAALQDFPHQAVSPRTVTVKLPTDNH